MVNFTTKYGTESTASQIRLVLTQIGSRGVFSEKKINSLIGGTKLVERKGPPLQRVQLPLADFFSEKKTSDTNVCQVQM